MQIENCKLQNGTAAACAEPFKASLGEGNQGGATHQTLTSSATRSGEHGYSVAHAAGFQDEEASEKEMRAVREKAAPLEPLARNAGNIDVFQEDQLELVEPLAKCPRFWVF